MHDARDRAAGIPACLKTPNKVPFSMQFRLNTTMVLTTAAFTLATQASTAADAPDASALKEKAARYAATATAYAEAMIEHGRDTYGEVHSPLFAAQMTRQEYKVPKDPHDVFPPMDDFGLRYDDRAWGSANAHHSIGLYELLYKMSENTGEEKYAAAADAAIEYTYKNLRSPKTDLLAWGEEISWMLHYDAPRLSGDGIMDGTYQGRSYDNDLHEPGTVWPAEFWDRAFTLAPYAAKAFCLGLWNHQIANQKTGAFSRHATYSRHKPRSGPSFPRVGSWMMMAWSKGYQHIHDDPAFRTTMLRAIETIADSYNNRRDPKTDALPAGGNKRYGNVFWTGNNLSMAVEVGQIVEMDVLPEKTAAKLRDLAARTDTVILTKLDHNLDGHLNDVHPSFTQGFQMRGRTDKLVDGHLKFGDPRHPLGKRPAFSSFWPGRHATTSSQAMNMFERADQLGDTPEAEKYRELAFAAAKLYITKADPDQLTTVQPRPFADMIEFMLVAHERTGERKYLEHAVYFADKAIELFFDDKSALPKVTSRHDFYEAQSGGPNLALALYNLATALD